MKLAQFRREHTALPTLGVLLDQKLIDIPAIAASMRKAGHNLAEWLLNANSTMEVIARGDRGLQDLRALIDGAGSFMDQSTSVPAETVTFLPAINAGKILAIGRNYADHAIEQGKEPPQAPLLFNKLPNTLNAHNAPIVLPSISEKVDYEAELAVIIGRRGKAVREDEALDYVFGYAPLNDVSARDLQFGDGQFTRGKGLDGFAPIGPYLTTRDEIADVHNLSIEGRLNGQVMQTSNTGKMIFKVPYLISYLSQGITLEPGDVIATGTPEGVGIFREPPVLLKPGDVFEVVIEDVGTLRNVVIGSE
jgi:2-keto-4-pentenoate hydratase/2-oxohepta-3-ene-1,7-dioic acid hydratase in catechol pathway